MLAERFLWRIGLYFILFLPVTYQSNQHSDIQHNDTQINAIQHKDIQLNGIQLNDIQYNGINRDTQHKDTRQKH